MSALPRGLAAAPLDPPQRRLEVGEQVGERPFYRCGARDQYVIGALSPSLRQDLGRRFPQPPLGAIAHDRIADLAAGGDAEADRRILARILRARRRL
jgi:hypothetical protein